MTALRWQGKLRTLARLVTLVTLVLGARISVAQSPPVAPSGAAPAVSASSATGSLETARAAPGPAGVAAEARFPEASRKNTSRPTALPTPGASGGVSAPSSEPAPGSAPREAPGGPAAMDGSTYLVRMRDLAQRIDDLKEQIRRSHTRLSLLSDTILSGGIGGARAEIRFQNDLSSAFRLTSALFVLDGQIQYSKQDETGALAEQRSIPVFTGSIPPGDHTLQVQIKLQGYGYGVFSYLRGYRFQTGAGHSFTVTEGKTIVLEVIAWEKGGVTTPLEERPAIRFKQTVKAGSGAANSPGGSGANGGGGATSGAKTGGR